MRLLRIVVTFLAFLAVPAVVGISTLAWRLSGPDALDPAPSPPTVPAPRPPTTTRALAVIVAGNRGTEITDLLPIVELLEDSGAFEVRVVAPRRVVSPFKSSAIDAAGADFVPDLGFDEYDALVGSRTPSLIVVPYVTAWRREDAAIVPWIVEHTGPTTTVMSICAGAEIAAATGLFDGHTATAHFAQIDALADTHPQIRYVRDVRWVRDRRRISSGTLTAGLDATLAAIDALAGRAAALRAAEATGYGFTGFLDDPRSVIEHPKAGIALEAAYRWERTSVAVLIDDGVSESDVAALLDTFATTMTTDAVAVGPARRVVTTRHGLALVPHDTVAHLASYDAVEDATATHAGHAYDRAILAVARLHGRPMARAAGGLLNYPTARLDVGGGFPLGLTMLFRAIALGLAGAWIARRILRRRCGDDRIGRCRGASLDPPWTTTLTRRASPPTPTRRSRRRRLPPSSPITASSSRSSRSASVIAR